MEEKENKGIRIFPRIKVNYSHSMYTKDAGKSFISEKSEMEIPEGQQPVTVSLGEDLLLCFAMDMETHYQLIQKETLEKNPQLTVEGIQAVAVNNLIREVGDLISLNGTPDDLMMITAGGNFEAALILIDALWSQIHDLFEGNVLITIPTKDVLLVCKPENEDAKGKMLGLVKNYFANPETEGLLSKAVYLRTRESKELEVVEQAF